MTKKPKDNTVGPWAKEKLEALGQYLSFYTTVLKKQGHWLRGTIFVDAFAGPGLSRVRTREKAAEPPGLFGLDPESDAAEVEFLKGSPRVALDIANPFNFYIFVEREGQRIAELKGLKVEYALTRDVTVRGGDANAALQSWLASGIDWQHYRAVVFLDPFGMQVPWSTIERSQRRKPLRLSSISHLVWQSSVCSQNRAIFRKTGKCRWMRSLGPRTGTRSSTNPKPIFLVRREARSALPA